MDIKTLYFLIFPNVNLLDFSGPLQVFITANELAEKSGHRRPYDIKVVACEPGQVMTQAGITVQAEPLPELDSPADTLIVAGGIGVESAANHLPLCNWLKEHASLARRIVSVCSGAFILAACGLLDGRRVVTHWSSCAELARRYSKLRVECDPIFIQDGPVWTSAGVTAGIDLALALLEEDLGHKLALDVARELVMFLKRPGGQEQFSAPLALQSSTSKFADLHAWMTNNLAGDLSVAALAARANMSERSFVRHYSQHTGITPAKAVERFRLEAARHLLVESTLSLKCIASRCGFGCEDTLRRSFFRMFGSTPQDYRKHFKATF
ncbi:GlxA family transcriptional regulator [Photorhabdus luminescens]|uniref:GlxA family transcriptional regulator n=1 Tax=Photorhabdus luminescens TaxID=29488 RepID=UPI00223ED3F1|nr:GlxA family transcriptional regulator [Photorhabdus luminescens]MCW7760661.1 GlxA family transcriptional regulator [Photorhabdus luminescens subsp. venezuelensis]